MKMILFAGLLLISGAAFTAPTAEAANPALKSGVFNPPRMAPEFSLPSSQGGQFTLAEQRGQPVVLSFGFSNCPQICPMTLATLADVKHQLGALADQVQVVFMTVDPERDSAEQLRTYLANFHPDFIGLTGAPEELAQVRAAYGITAQREDQAGGYYEVHHSSYIYLVDRQGQLRSLVPFGTGPNDIVHDLKILLQENPEPSTS